MALNIVLVHPQIPQNTGNIARLTAATGAHLHLIEPLGFEITEKNVKRAGLDYWSEVSLTSYASWKDFLDQQKITKPTQLWFFSKLATIGYHEVEYSKEQFLVYGSETSGLPEDIRKAYPSRMLRIPMENPKVRSFNLSNSVALTMFEARRQCGLLSTPRLFD